MPNGSETCARSRATCAGTAERGQLIGSQLALSFIVVGEPRRSGWRPLRAQAGEDAASLGGGRVVAVDRASRLLQAAAVREVSRVNRREPDLLDQLGHDALGGGVVTGEVDRQPLI